MPLKRCLFIAVVECAIKKKLKTLSIETLILVSPLFLYIVSIKKKLKTLSIETSVCHLHHLLCHWIKKKLKTLSIETFVNLSLIIFCNSSNKEKAQNIEHRNFGLFRSKTNQNKSYKEKAQNIEHRNRYLRKILSQLKLHIL
mgnify:CR=1 FL=1